MSWKTHNVSLFVEMTLENDILLFYDSLMKGCVAHYCVKMSIHSRLVTSGCIYVCLCMETQITNLADLGISIQRTCISHRLVFLLNSYVNEPPDSCKSNSDKTTQSRLQWTISVPLKVSQKR